MLMVHSKSMLIHLAVSQPAQATSNPPSRLQWFGRYLLRALAAWAS
jgi:hypothetical protein